MNNFTSLLEQQDSMPVDFARQLAKSAGSQADRLFPLKHISRTKEYQLNTKPYPSSAFGMLDDLFDEHSRIANLYINDEIPHDEPDWPGEYLAARIVFIALARGFAEGWEIYLDLLSVEPQGRDPNAHHNRMRIRNIIPNAIPMRSHKDLEEAFCELVGVPVESVEDEGKITTSLVSELMQAMAAKLEVVLNDPESDKAKAILHAASASLIAALWQCFPALRPNLQTQTRWLRAA